MMKKGLIICGLFFLGCSSTENLREKYQGISKNAPSFRYMSSWKNALGEKNLEEIPMELKIRAASKEEISYIKKLNVEENYLGIPLSVELDSVLKNRFLSVIQCLPKNILELVNSRLMSIVTLSGLGSSGMVETVFDSAGHSKAGIVFLDVALLDHPANEWATWRENTPFFKEKGWELKVRIAPDSLDNSQTALQYILLHEFGHIVSIDRKIHPNWDLPDAYIRNLNSFKYPSIGWEKNADKHFVLKAEKEFPLRKKVVYYRKAKLSVSKAPKAYQDLEKVGIPALYGATNLYDDFAETFAVFVHTRLLGLPFQVDIINDGKQVFSHQIDWNDSRLLARKKFMESLAQSTQVW